MDRTPVVSSHLASVGYDPTTSTLEIGFRDGRVYQYDGVPEILYRGLMAATASHGTYFDVFIKKAKFPYERVQ